MQVCFLKILFPQKRSTVTYNSETSNEYNESTFEESTTGISPTNVISEGIFMFLQTRCNTYEIDYFTRSSVWFAPNMLHDGMFLLYKKEGRVIPFEEWSEQSSI